MSDQSGTKTPLYTFCPGCEGIGPHLPVCSAQPVPYPILTGWVCPKCCRVWAPNVSGCTCSIPGFLWSSTSGGTYGGK